MPPSNATILKVLVNAFVWLMNKISEIVGGPIHPFPTLGWFLLVAALGLIGGAMLKEDNGS